MVPENDPMTQVGPLVFSGAYYQAGVLDENRFIVGTAWEIWVISLEPIFSSGA